MGDRYELILDCVYCGKQNDDIWYAPTCNSLTFKCEKCKKVNFITSDLESMRIEDVSYDDVWMAINNSANLMNNEQIEECAKQSFEKLKGGKKK